MWNNLAEWLKQPFNSEMSAGRWFAFIGLILVSLYLWHVIARDWSRLE